MRKAVTVLLLLLAVSVGVSQTRILLYGFEARNIDESIIQMAGQLIKDALNGTYQYVVVEPAPGTYCYNVVAAADSARQYTAAKALIGNIMAVGGKQFLTFQVVDAASGRIDLADKIELPPTDEFPTMADRIANSVVENKPYYETVERDQLTTPEVAPRFKHPRKPYTSLFLTGGYMFHLQERKHPTDPTVKFSTQLVNLNLAVTFETQQMLTMLQLGLMRGIHDETDVSFDLLGNYVFGKGDFAPIVGGGIGITRYNWTEYGAAKHNDGLNLSAGVGMLGLRSYYFRLITAAYLTYTVPANDWDNIPGVKVMFGVTTPTIGPDATVKMPTGCVGATIGGFFLTGLILALVT